MSQSQDTECQETKSSDPSEAGKQVQPHCGPSLRKLLVQEQGTWGSLLLSLSLGGIVVSQGNPGTQTTGNSEERFIKRENSRDAQRIPLSLQQNTSANSCMETTRQKTQEGLDNRIPVITDG